ncbi:MAG: hypothetical protein ACRD1I_02425 [Terriglobia bacterium]
MGCLFVIALSFAGCRPGVMGTYQLENIGNELVVIPPPYSEHSPGNKVEVEFPLSRRLQRGKSGDCSVKSGPFRLSAKPSHWKAALPSLRTWTKSLARDTFHQQFENFLDQIGTLSDNGCISSNESVLLQKVVRESVPVRPQETLLYRYGYRPGPGFVDLEPGMRLVVERAEYDQSDKFKGTSIVDYQITRNSRAWLRFRPAEVKRQGKSRVPTGDLDLDARVNKMLYCRLFFSGNLVPKNLDYTAMIIGTHSRKQMEEITQALQEHPQSGCAMDLIKNASCKPFIGSVTVSAELKVTVNGKEVFIGPQATLQGALAAAGAARCEDNLKALRVERKFLGRPAKLVFDPPVNSILNLIVVGNDRIFCSASAPSRGLKQ